MTQELTTTRDAGGAIKTTTPGAPSAGYGALFDALIRQKMAQQAYQRAQAQAPVPMAQRGYQEPSRPTYQPTLGQAPISPAPQKAPATRMRRVQIRTAIPSIMEGEGLTYNTVPETQLADGSWSLDAVHGTLDGNEAAARQRMATIDRRENIGGGSVEDARPYKTGSPEAGREGDPVRVASSNPYNRNNDARGEGYGMDYGRGAKGRGAR